MKRLLAVLTLVLIAAAASAQPPTYTFVRDNEGRPVFGRGTRPVVTGQMGIPAGTPFFDTTDNTLYYWSGSDWTAAATSASTQTALRDPSQLDAESLTNPNLTSGTSWTQTADFALTANAATYTHNTGAGTFQQTSAAGAIPWAGIGSNGWFIFTYTTSAITGTVACTIPSTFALTAQTLVTREGTFSATFQAKTGTVGAFSVACTSAATATITFDTLSLKRITGGSLSVQGRVLAGVGSVAASAFSFVNDPDTGFNSLSTGAISVNIDGANYWGFGTTALYPGATNSYDLGKSNLLVRTAYVGTSIEGSNSFTLTDNTKAAFAKIAVAAASYGGADVHYTLECKDANDQVTRTGYVPFSFQNTGGTETCAVGNAASTDALASPDSTNNAKAFTTVTFTCADGGTNTIQLEVQADCTIAAPTSLTIQYLPIQPKFNTVTPGT